MEISLSSSLSSCRPFMSSSSYSSKRLQVSQRRIAVSCRASGAFMVQERDTNFYSVLALSQKNSTADDIKRAYRSMALKYHPDVCHDPSMKEESTKMFVQLNEAYKTLSNPSLRQEYDCELSLKDNMMSAFSSTEFHEMRLWQEEEGAELKRRNDARTEKKKGSSGTRMRTRNKGRD